MSEILEKGDAYFVYRPAVAEDSPDGLEDVQRFFVILQPHDREPSRLLVIGQKKLPRTEKHGRYWGFVDRVDPDVEALGDELDAAESGGPARPAGEGVYAIVRHEDHTHLAYALELPEDPGEVQEAFRLEPEASYVLTIKNPEASSPSGAGLDEERRADYPEALQERFGDRRFVPADPPGFLDHEGCEFVLIGAARDAEEELQITLNAHEEDTHSADVFDQLRLERENRPTEPLLEGRWR